MKNVKDYLLSIVIPTRNRAQYANLSIRQCLNITSEDVQIVVQDNSDNNDLELLLKDLFGVERIIYNHINGVLSFVDNFDYALQNATGRYVSIIGDDDGITTGMYLATKWADTNGYKAIKPNLNIVYFWPQSKVFKENEDNGILKIMDSTGSVKDSNPQKELKRLLNNSCQNYLNMDLVKIYHGIVNRELLEEVKEKIGKYVAGLSPDIYMSVSLTSVLDSAIKVIDIPLTISGICPASGSSASATGAHTGELKDAPHFVGHDTYEWKREVPEFYSVETIWADSALAAIYDMNKSLLKYYKPDQLAAISLKKYNRFRTEILNNYRSNGGNAIRLSTCKTRKFVHRVINGIYHRIFKRNTQKWDGVVDIQAASDIVEPLFKDKYAFFGGND